MEILSHEETPLEEWRPGVMTQMRVSAVGRSHQLCIFEQWCDEGLGAPTHLHAVEEVLEVLSGTAEIWLSGDSELVSANQSVLIPAGEWHGFRNTGSGKLHVRATLASPVFEASYEDRNELTRRWLPGG